MHCPWQQPLKSHFKHFVGECHNDFSYLQGPTPLWTRRLIDLISKLLLRMRSPLVQSSLFHCLLSKDLSVTEPDGAVL